MRAGRPLRWAAAVLWLALPASAQDRVALVIGNADYDTVGALDNPSNDASMLAIALEGLGFDVRLGLDLDRDGMRALTRDFGRAAATAEAALVFYAGHGFQVAGENYLVPVDASIAVPADIARETVALAEIVAELETTDALKIVILDACRDNPLGASEADLGVEAGLARVGTEADFLFVYATQPDNIAYDGTGENSFFTEALLSHLYTPGQDVAALMTHVRRDVLAATGGRQIPWESSSLTRRFAFDRSPPTASEETLLWQVAAASDDPRLVELYMRRYPDGAHAGDVRALLAANDDALTRRLAPANVDLQAERLWSLAQRTRMPPLIEFYLDQYPDGAHRDEAIRLLDVLPRAEDDRPAGICERLAMHPRDATGSRAGVPFDHLRRNALTAIQACSAAAVQSPELPHYTALLARATIASGDVARAVRLYRDAAGRGDVRAMVSLAQLTETGTGLPADPQAAVALYEEAAARGSPDAMINLAVTLFEGDGSTADRARGVGLLRRAADAGSAKAVFNLGVLAQDGAAGDPATALPLFERAAQDGEHGGWRAAAILLDEGRGVPRDTERAANMLLRGSAEDDGTLNRQLTGAAEQWSRDTLAAVQARLRAAGLYHSSVDGIAGPAFAAALDAWRNGGFAAEVLVN